MSEPAFDERPAAPPQPTVIPTWILLVLLVLLVIFLQRWNMAMMAQQQAGAAGPPPPTVDLVLTSRLAVGWEHLWPDQPGAATADNGQVIQQLAARVDRPANRVRLAIVQAELEGAEAALDSLAAIELPADPQRAEALQRDIELLRQIYTGTDGAALPDEAAQRLIDRHDWFGRLAVSYGQPPGAPQREAALAPAMRAAMAAAGIGLLVTAGVIVGLALFVVAIVGLAQGWIRAAYERPVTQRTAPFLEAVPIFLLLMLVVSIAVGVIAGLFRVNVGFLVYVVTPLAIFWPLVRGIDWGQLRRAYGWHRGNGAIREAVMGVAGYLAGVPLMALGLVLTLGAQSLFDQGGEHPIVYEVAGGGPIQLFIVFAGAALWAPLVEETLFRGGMYHHLRRGHGIILSAVVVGLIFAVVHPQGIVGVPFIAMLGVVFALIREWRGSTLGPMVAHGVHNLVVTLVLVLILR